MRNPSPSSSSAAAPAVKKTAAKTTKNTPMGLKRGPWTPEEDELLFNYINREGEGKWRTLPKRAGLLRCGKSCRLRWMNYLRPCVKRGQITPDEEDLILRLHRLLGNRWSLIAGRIPGRTDNEIKNYWNTHLSKKLISQGIDPRTHKPIIASSSKPNGIIPTCSNPRPDNNNDNVGEETNSFIANKDLQYDLQSASIDHLEYQLVPGTSPGLLNSYKNNNGENEEEEDMMNSCNDDVFSSFLNSLINEEAFTTDQHDQVPQQQEQMVEPNSDPLGTISASFLGLGTSWESPLVSSNTFSQNDPKRVDDHGN